MISAAAHLASHLEARQVSSGRWIARCPAHADRAPSLTIAEGREGRALLHCFAGCELQAILHGAGLAMPHLFPPSAVPHAGLLAAASRAAEQRRDQQATERRLERRRIDQLRLQFEDLQRLATSLARRLATLPVDTPGGDELTACFHQTLDDLRAIDGALMEDTKWL